MRRLTLSVACLLATPATTQQPTWSLVPCAASPDCRFDHSAAYDIGRSRLVVFAGRGQGPLIADIWEFDGSAWQQRSPATSPPARWAQAMAFDPGNGRVVLFGGTTGHLGQSIADTWEWDGQAWTLRAPATSPPRRLAHAMASDWANGRVIMFGGRDAQLLYGDTWAWDGTTWTMLTNTGPPARCSLDIAQDIGRNRIVLFGGWNQNDLGDTWEFDGNAWQQCSVSNAPSARRDHRMAFDMQSGALILHGGTTGLDETWQWDGVAWTLLCTTPAAGRACHELEFDAANGRVTMFGGNTQGCDETWTFGVSSPATLTPFGAACSGPAGTPVLWARAGGLPWIGQSFVFELAPVSTFAFILFGWSDTAWGSISLPYSLARLGAPGCNVLVSNDTAAGTAALRTATFTVALPYSPGLVGIRFYGQGAVLDPGANALGLTVSNGTAATIGWQ